MGLKYELKLLSCPLSFAKSPTYLFLCRKSTYSLCGCIWGLDWGTLGTCYNWKLNASRRWNGELILNILISSSARKVVIIWFINQLKILVVFHVCIMRNCRYGKHYRNEVKCAKLKLMCYNCCRAECQRCTSYTVSYLGSLIPWGVRNSPTYSSAETKQWTWDNVIDWDPTSSTTKY